MALSHEPHERVSSKVFTTKMEKFENEHGEVSVENIIKNQIPELTTIFLATANYEVQEVVRYNILKVLNEFLLIKETTPEA